MTLCFAREHSLSFSAALFVVSSTCQLYVQRRRSAAWCIRCFLVTLLCLTSAEMGSFYLILQELLLLSILLFCIVVEVAEALSPDGIVITLVFGFLPGLSMLFIA